MPVLEWDEIGQRTFESGLDRGVLYLPDGNPVPWNGIISVIEAFDKETNAVYYDGMKISDLVSLGSFSATMSAVTYPDEFVELEGLAPVRPGLYYADQPPKTFGLCYRTRIGNDVEGDEVGYKIHILYNVTAIPSDKTYATVSDDPSLVEFEWELTAIPEEVPGFRPTAHIVIDTREIDPWLLEDLEEILYGSNMAWANLIPMQELVTKINTWFRVQIIDHGDGTWSAVSEREGFISVDVITDIFEITGVNAVYLDDDTYLISDTTSISEVPQIKITDHGDGTWSANTDHENLIFVTGDTFEIRNANAEFLNEYTYRISETTD